MIRQDSSTEAAATITCKPIPTILEIATTGTQVSRPMAEMEMMIFMHGMVTHTQAALPISTLAVATTTTKSM